MRAVGLVLVAGMLVVGVPSALADRTLSDRVSAHNPFSGGDDPVSHREVDAFASHVVWFDGTEFRERFRGNALRVPIPRPREVAELDLGPGPDGRTMAVYARCPGGRKDRCGLFTWDFREPGERRVRDTRGAYVGSIWRNRIAYIRDVGGTSRLYVRGLTGGSARRLAMGRLRGRYSPHDGIDFDGTRVVFAASARRNRLPWFIRQTRLGGRPVTLYQYTLADFRRNNVNGQLFFNPTIANRRIWWARFDQGCCDEGSAGYFWRVSPLGRSRMSSEPPNSQYPSGFAVDAGRVYAVLSDDFTGGDWELRELTGLRWRR